jgi:hypothetical protein
MAGKPGGFPRPVSQDHSLWWHGVWRMRTQEKMWALWLTYLPTWCLHKAPGTEGSGKLNSEGGTPLVPAQLVDTTSAMVASQGPESTRTLAHWP